MSYFMIWYTDIGISKDGKVGEYEDYAVVKAENSKDAWKKATEMFGDYVISVEPYNP